MMHMTKMMFPVLLLLPASLLAGGLGGNIETGISAAKIGDLGKSYGLEAGYQLTPALRTRLSYSTLDYQTDQTFGSIRFTEELDQKNARLTLDWFPQRKADGLYGSAGLVHLGEPSKLAATLTPGLNYPVNGVVYSAAQLGQISGTLETSKTVPYAGVGYNHHFGKNNGNGWYVQAEAGSVFGLDPQLKMQSTGVLPGLADNLNAYAAQESTKLKDSYAIYGITIGYRF